MCLSAEPTLYICPPQSDKDWKDLVKLYEHAFPSWEREPSENILETPNSYRRDISVLKSKSRVLGFSIVDYIETHDYALFSYLAIESHEQGRGYGSILCLDAIHRFLLENQISTLFIEAEDRQARLYNLLGFSYIPIDYRVPKYGSKGSVKMNLMSIPALNFEADLTKKYIKQFLQHNFTFGYDLKNDDPRLIWQMKFEEKLKVA